MKSTAAVLDGIGHEGSLACTNALFDTLAAGHAVRQGVIP